MFITSALQPVSPSILHEWFPFFLKTGFPLLVQTLAKSESMKRAMKKVLREFTTLVSALLATAKKALTAKPRKRRRKVVCAN